MSFRRYALVFGGGLALIAALVATPYVLEAYGVTSPLEDLPNFHSDSSGLSLFNIGVTIILFMLLAFSILNIYSFFNSQIDSEKRALKEKQAQLEHELDEKGKQIASRADAIRGDLSELENRSLYQRNLLFLMSQQAPVFVRTAAAGYFVAHRPLDNDLHVIRLLREELEKCGEECRPIVSQLDTVEQAWAPSE